MGAFEPYPLALQEIIAAAERGTDKDWKFVDQRLPELVQHPSAIQWARKEGLGNKESGDLRDLAASIFEKYHGPLTSQDHHTLRQIKRYDAHKPAGFRAACALWMHGERDENVENALHKVSQGKDSVMRAHALELLEQKNKKNNT